MSTMNSVLLFAVIVVPSITKVGFPSGPVPRTVLDPGEIPFRIAATVGFVVENDACACWKAPAFVFALDLDVTVPGFDHPVRVDVAWGGMIYVLVDAKSVGLEIKSANGRRLVEVGEAIKKAVQEQTDFVHPENPGIRGVSILEFTDDLRSDGEGRKTALNTVVVSPGRLDRSPCGTGTCARMAVLHKRGLLAENEPFHHTSVIGTEFIGHVRGTAKVGEYDAVIPFVKGSAWITAYKQVLLHPTDPFPEGFRVGDKWHL